MDIYTVVSITEAEYGCEETNREEPMALLKLMPLEPSNDGTRYVEVAESILSSQGIEEGKKVCFAADGSIRKYVRVVAAVIRDCRHHGKRIFATARGYGEYKGWWEFPGGKIEPGETPQEALEREIREELDTKITVRELIKTIEYDYPKFHLSMDCFWADIVEGHLELKEAEDARWLAMDELGEVNWLPADQELIEFIILKRKCEKCAEGNLMGKREREDRVQTASEREKIEAIPEKVQKLIAIVNELEDDFPERHFTLDGHLVGSIGEVMAKYYYGVELAKPSEKLHDGKVEYDTFDKRNVQIKITQQDNIVINGKPDYLIVMYLTKAGDVYEVYNGPGEKPWESASSKDSHNNRHMLVNKLMELDADVAPKDRIKVINGRSIEKMRKEYKNKKKPKKMEKETD